MMKQTRKTSELLRSVQEINLKPKNNRKKFALMMGLLLVSSTALAAGGDSTINTALTGLLDIMTGVVAETIATIAIAATGWAWMTSQISLKTASIIGMGIGIVFGAPEIASALGAHG